MNNEMELAEKLRSSVIASFMDSFDVNHFPENREWAVPEGAMPFFESLSDDQKKMYRKVSERIAVDVTSIVLGIVCGKSFGFEGFEVSFRDVKLTDLQESFLIAVQEHEVASGMTSTKPAF